MRSDVEQQLNLIASGKAAHGDVLEYFLKMFAKKFAYFTKQVNLWLIRMISNWLNSGLSCRLKPWTNCLKPHSHLLLQRVDLYQNVVNVRGKVLFSLCSWVLYLRGSIDT